MKFILNAKGNSVLDIQCILSYNSIVTQNKVNSQMTDNDLLKKIYYTALGRERYSMYRVNNPFLENN